ncbi:MAG: polysulfide reductase NrfD [Armatimonadetes bacterium]|nr:polysulfide reductase NrfD [Armatimonadota bacterium]
MEIFEHSRTIYSVPHEIPLGVLIAVYFYLTVLSAGSFVISVVANLLGLTQYKPIAKITAVLAPLLLMIAPLNLIIDLEQKPRFWELFVFLNPTSPITWGSFLLTLYPLSAIIYAYFVFTGNKSLSRLFGIIGIPLAISVHGYTGFILALAKGRALWNTFLMPVLFLVSAMVSGIALVIIVYIGKLWWFSKGKSPEEMEKEKGLVSNMCGILVGSIVTDLFLIFCDVAVLMTSISEAKEVAHLITMGKFAPYFLGVELFMGGVIPLILLTTPATKRNLGVQFAASLLVMAGIMAMRYVVVVGGQYIPLSM